MNSELIIQGLVSASFFFPTPRALIAILNEIEVYQCLQGKQGKDKTIENSLGVDWQNFVQWLPICNKEQIFPEKIKKILCETLKNTNDSRGAASLIVNKFCTGVKIVSHNKRLSIEINLSSKTIVFRWSSPTIKSKKWVKKIANRLPRNYVNFEWSPLIELIVPRQIVVNSGGKIQTTSRRCFRISEDYYAVYDFPTTWKDYHRYIKKHLKKELVTSKPAKEFADAPIIDSKTILVLEYNKEIDELLTIKQLKEDLKPVNHFCKVEKQIYLFPDRYGRVSNQIYSSYLKQNVSLTDLLQNLPSFQKVEIKNRTFYVFQANYKVDLQNLASQPYDFKDTLVLELAKQFLS